MEFVCQKESLQAGVSIVERVVSTRSTLPIISNILFEAKKGSLKISANNLEMGIEYSIPANVTKEGSILIPSKTLAGIVSKLPDAEIGFKLKENNLVNISYKKSKLNIHGLPADEFPQLPKVKEVNSFEIEAKVLADMLKYTIFSTSTSEEKHVLNGVLFETGRVSSDSSNLRLVATDGYRMAKRGEKIKNLEVLTSAIVPSRALSELLRIIQGADEGEVKIIVATDQISFTYDNSYVVSRLIQGQFPDYRRVIPKSSDVTVTVNTKSLLESSERTAVIASQSANLVKIEVTKGQMVMSAQVPDVGAVEEVLEAEVQGKDKITVAFNVRLLTDALRVIETDKVSLELGENLSPGLIRPKDGPDFTYLVMPIRTKEEVA